MKTRNDQHGTTIAYNNGCRCLQCRAAIAAYRLRHIPAGPIPHGTRNGYNNHRCRCARCVDANSIYMRRWKVGDIVRKWQAGSR